MKFLYKAKEITIEAYGKTLLLAKRTPRLLEELAKTDARVQSDDIVECARAMYDSVGLMIGEQIRDTIFPNFEDCDIAELRAFREALIEAYQGAEA